MGKSDVVLNQLLIRMQAIVHNVVSEHIHPLFRQISHKIPTGEVGRCYSRIF